MDHFLEYHSSREGTIMAYALALFVNYQVNIYSSWNHFVYLVKERVASRTNTLIHINQVLKNKAAKDTKGKVVVVNSQTNNADLNPEKQLNEKNA